MPKFKLYHYWRSSTSWRVRWAFAIKNISCEFVAINLLSDENLSPEHLKRNPMGYVPVLEFTEEPKRYLAESLAIIEWLEETFPNPKLLPGDTFQRAKIRQLAETVNANIHPVQNLTVREYYSPDPEKQKIWAQYWITNGLKAYETLVQETAGKFSVGNTLTLADLCLIPQCYNALRNAVPLELFPTVHRIYLEAMSTESCLSACPDQHAPPRLK